MGGPELEVEVPEGVTVGELLALVSARAGDAPLPPPAVALNQRYARAAEVVRPGDEVAIIPPVAGG